MTIAHQETKIFAKTRFRHYCRQCGLTWFSDKEIDRDCDCERPLQKRLSNITTEEQFLPRKSPTSTK